MELWPKRWSIWWTTLLTPRRRKELICMRRALCQAHLLWESIKLRAANWSQRNKVRWMSSLKWIAQSESLNTDLETFTKGSCSTARDLEEAKWLSPTETGISVCGNQIKCVILRATFTSRTVTSISVSSKPVLELCTPKTNTAVLKDQVNSKSPKRVLSRAILVTIWSTVSDASSTLTHRKFWSVTGATAGSKTSWKK